MRNAMRQSFTGILVTFLVSFILATIPGQAAVPDQSSNGASQEKNPLKLVWISLDALNANNLKPYLDLIKTPHRRGLKWFVENAHGKRDLQVSFPSITAASHISTLTCASPSIHGVFLNSGNWDGKKDQNGFAMAYTTENWVQALRKSGIKVGVASYPSVDGSSELRSADLGVAYDSPVGKVQYIKLSKTARTAQLEFLSRQVIGLRFRETLALTANGDVVATGELGDSGVLNVGKPIDLFFVDGPGSGKDRKAAVTFMNLGTSGSGIDSEVVIAVSPLSLMPVTGDALTAALDQKNIVWSNLRDYGLAKYGDGVSFTLEATRHRRLAELAAIREMVKMKQAQALFLYFEDIDVVLHAWSGVTSLNSKLAGFFSTLDQDLGNLIESFPEGTNFVVMGDHGMTSVQYELNVRRLLPAGTAKQFQIRTSGGTLALYPAGALDSQIPADLNLLAVADALKNATVEFDGGKHVFRKVVVNGTAEAKELGVSGAKSPWIMAFADEGISVTDRMDDRFLISKRDTFVIPDALRSKYPDPMNNGILVQPAPLGAHGHDATLPSMRTHLAVFGPELGAIDLASIKASIQVVPKVANTLGWSKPSSCR